MKNYNNLILDIENDFYLIKINRPKFLNALNQENHSTEYQFHKE